MPITLTNTEFTDVFGNVTNVFKANAGDLVSCKHSFKSAVYTSSLDNNNITIDKLYNRLTRSIGSWINDGFRVGDTYTFKVVNDVNSVVNTYTGTINEVYDTYMIVTGLPSMNGVSSSSSGYIYHIYTTTSFDYLKLGLNFVDNDNPNPSLQSLIDGESSVFAIDGISALSIASSLTLGQLGKKSGNYSISNVQVTRNANISNPFGIGMDFKTFDVTFDITFLGNLFPDAFKGSKCLKLYTQFELKMDKDEKYIPYTFKQNEKADTGYFDEGYNSEATNITSVTGPAKLYYNEPTTFNFSVVTNNSALTEFELGACYISIDEDYNLNKKESQDTYLPILRSGVLTDTSDGWTASSSGNAFDLTLVSVTRTTGVGTSTFSGSITFNPNYANANDFGKLIESRGDNERHFIVYFKVGNTNAILFDSQLEYKEPIGVEITPLESFFINHDQNNDHSDLTYPPSSDTDFNIQDDIAYFCEFELNESDVNEKVNIKVVCFNTSDNSEFELQSLSYDISQQDLNNWINTSQDVNLELPVSSAKRTSYLNELTPISAGVIQLRLYYPFLIRWEDFIQQLNATSYFKSNSIDTQNWMNYFQSTYQVRMKLEIERNGVVDYCYEQVVFYDYDDSTVVTTIQLFDSTGTTEYNTIVNNQIYLVKATNVFPSDISAFYSYGQITIQQKNAKPRTLISTEIDCDLGNPLYGINNNRVELNLINPTTIELTCLLDANKLNGSNYEITSKISTEGYDNNHIEYTKLMEDGTIKLTEDAIEKITD